MHHSVRLWKELDAPLGFTASEIAVERLREACFPFVEAGITESSVRAGNETNVPRFEMSNARDEA
jgi:hypothetical protein